MSERQSQGVLHAVEQIREFADGVDDPDKWRVLIPEPIFDDVKAGLETTEGLGTYYEGISLCYADSLDEIYVRYRSELSDHE